MESISIEVADWGQHGEALRAIREEVFVVEQGVPREIELDDADESATHFLLRQGSTPLACGRLSPEGKVGRMAVRKDYRKRGLGLQLLNYIIAHARRQGLGHLRLHAQQSAIGFYRSAGFSVYGEPFEEAGIPHVAMELVIG